MQLEDTLWSKKNFGITAATYGLLALAGVVSFSLPAAPTASQAASVPADASNLFRTDGTVRDLQKASDIPQTSPDLVVEPVPISVPAKNH